MFHNNDKTVKISSSGQLLIQTGRWVVLSLLVVLSGCIKYQYKPEPIDESLTLNTILNSDPRDGQFLKFLQLNNYPTDEWPIEKWDLQALTLASIYFNPAIKVAESELALQRAAEITAGQRTNPSVGIPLEHHSASGDSPWLIGIVTDFLFERADKREAIMQQAVSKKQAAEINLEQQVWSIYSELHKSLLDYYAAVKQKELLIVQQDLLKENLGLLERRQELGQVSQFELSSIRLELQHIQLRISDQDYVINDAFHSMVSNTGLQVDKFNKEEFVFSEMENEPVIDELDEATLREELLNNRFDIRVKLKKYEALEAALRLEIIKQYPDLNLSPGFIFDQGDKIWTLGATWILPLFHNNEGQIEEALAARQKLQAEFMQLQTSLINELSRKRQNYLDKLISYKKARQLMNELTDRDKQIRKQFDLGYADSLSVIRSKTEIEKARQAVFAIKMDVLRAGEQLEQITQQPMDKKIDIKTLTHNIVEQDK